MKSLSSSDYAIACLDDWKEIVGNEIKRSPDTCYRACMVYYWTAAIFTMPTQHMVRYTP